ncbi:MAG: GNAT family N-acetyltransferase [Sphaerochaetaceae bacterium]
MKEIDSLVFVFIPVEASMPLTMDSCREIRRRVFIEEQAVPSEVEQDSNDALSAHLLLTKGAHPIGTLRIRKTEEGLKLERIALLKEYRGNKLGRLLVIEGVKRARELYQKERIYVHSQVQASNFYASLGFKRGDKYIEEGQRLHVVMTLSETAEKELLLQ